MIGRAPLRLNLGAGGYQPPGYVHVDRAAVPGINVVHDLDAAPWPWLDSSVDEIMAKDVFEHVDDPVTFMTECHRVLRTGGTLRMQTPHWRSEQAFTDPTHKRFPTEFTWDYWIPGTILYEASNAAYGGVAFERVRMQVGASIVIELSKMWTGNERRRS